jgi:predicted O-linked N-acetylglucosamine transferase (SPINDLY family)
MRRGATTAAWTVAIAVAIAVASANGASKKRGNKPSPGGMVVQLTQKKYTEIKTSKSASAILPGVVLSLSQLPQNKPTNDDTQKENSLLTKVRRLAKTYEGKFGFFFLVKGEFPEYDKKLKRGGKEQPILTIVTSNVMNLATPEHSFDPAQEMTLGNLKDWIDKFLSGKMVKIRPSLDELENCHTLKVDDKEKALFLNDLAVQYQDAGNMEMAIQQLEAARLLDPVSPIIHYNTGQVREMMGEMEAAIAEYKAALDNDIRYMDAYHSLARAISVLGDAESAVNILQLATKMQPYDGAMYNSLGVALRANNSYAKALESFTLALSLNHTMDEALLNIGSTYMDLGDFERSIGFFMRALEMNEFNFAALANIVYCNQKLYNWQDYDHFHALLEQSHDVYDQLVHPFHAAAYPGSPERFKDLAVAYASNTLALVHPKFRLSHREPNATSTGGRIRLGYISTDIRRNPTRDLILNMMQMHNRDDFEVYYFALDRDNKFVGKYVDNFVDLSVTPYRKVAVVIKELAIDVLINTMVPTDSWFRVAGLNPSFCQVSLAAGYPGTTGTKVVNYVISDRVISPPELQHLYVEKIAFTQYALHPLSQPIDFEGEVDTPLLTRESLGIPSDTFVFAYFESPQRETTFPSGMLPQTFAVWCSVLHRAPQSLLVLLGIKPESGTAQRVLKEGAVRGLAAVRFVFVSSNDLTLGVQEREVKELANLFLDNLGVNAQFAPSAFPWLVRVGTACLC